MNDYTPGLRVALELVRKRIFASPREAEQAADAINEELKFLTNAVEKFLNASGHDLCHENRHDLATAFGLQDKLPARPASVEEFAQGCNNYQRELYNDCPMDRLRELFDREKEAHKKTAQQYVETNSKLQLLERRTAKMLSIRDFLRNFVLLQEDRLRQHDAERGYNGWIGARAVHIIYWIRRELDELILALRSKGADAIRGEAADLANLAMMIASNAALYVLPEWRDKMETNAEQISKVAERWSQQVTECKQRIFSLQAELQRNPSPETPEAENG